MIAATLRNIGRSARRAWRGDERLLIAFGGWFVGTLAVFALLHILEQRLVDLYVHSTFLSSNLFFAIDTLLSTVPRLLLIMVVWRCARNTSKQLWFYLARILMVVYLVLLIAAGIFEFAKFTGEKKHASSLIMNNEGGSK